MNWRRWLEWGGYAAGAVRSHSDRGDRVGAERPLDRPQLAEGREDHGHAGHDPGSDQGRGRTGRPRGRLIAVVLCRRQGHQQRRPGALLRPVHANPRAGGDRRPGLRRYAALRDGRREGNERRAKASKGPSGHPLDNPARQVWITETALSTALNVSYMADQLALLSLVVGIALLLTGVGFIILAAGGALRRTTAAAAPRPEVAPAS